MVNLNVPTLSGLSHYTGMNDSDSLRALQAVGLAPGGNVLGSGGSIGGVNMALLFDPFGYDSMFGMGGGTQMNPYANMGMAGMNMNPYGNMGMAAMTMNPYGNMGMQGMNMGMPGFGFSSANEQNIFTLADQMSGGRLGQEYNRAMGMAQQQQLQQQQQAYMQQQQYMMQMQMMQMQQMQQQQSSDPLSLLMAMFGGGQTQQVPQTPTNPLLALLGLGQSSGTSGAQTNTLEALLSAFGIAPQPPQPADPLSELLAALGLSSASGSGSQNSPEDLLLGSLAELFGPLLESGGDLDLTSLIAALLDS